MRCEPCPSKMRRIGLPDVFLSVAWGMKHCSNHWVHRNLSVQPFGDTETLHSVYGELCKHRQSCFDSLNFRIDFQPSLVELLSREHEPGLNGISYCVDALDDHNKLQVPTSLAITWSFVSRHKVFLSRSFSPSSPLTTLLIHVPDILPRDVKFLKNLCKKLKVICDRCAIETLRTFWIEARGLPKLKAWVPSKELGDPLLSCPDTTTSDVLDFLSQCPFAKGYALVTELCKPFDKDVFLYGAEVLLELMGMVCIPMSSI